MSQFNWRVLTLFLKCLLILLEKACGKTNGTVDSVEARVGYWRSCSVCGSRRCRWRLGAEAFSGAVGWVRFRGWSGGGVGGASAGGGRAVQSPKRSRCPQTVDLRLRTACVHIRPDVYSPASHVRAAASPVRRRRAPLPLLVPTLPRSRRVRRPEITCGVAGATYQFRLPSSSVCTAEIEVSLFCGRIDSVSTVT